MKNFLDPLLLCAGIAQSVAIIVRFRPDVIVHAGSFVGVPVAAAGWLLGIKIVIVQLDVTPTLSNRICVPFANAIALATDACMAHFPKRKATITGIPIRKAIVDGARKDDIRVLRKSLGIGEQDQVVLVVGGGTGAAGLNALIRAALKYMDGSYHVIHITGGGKSAESVSSPTWYHPIEFLAMGIETLLSTVDCAVSRAGMGMIGEIAAARIPALLVPLPDSHQEANAAYFEQRKCVRYVNQKKIAPPDLAREIAELLHDTARREAYVAHMSSVLPVDGAHRVAALL